MYMFMFHNYDFGYRTTITGPSLLGNFDIKALKHLDLQRILLFLCGFHMGIFANYCMPS